ncbi:acetyltransferase, partial [Paenibacillus chitinolyticus]|nr:acetyltransferase [Paenibacillus chitinolyticus]
MRDIARAGGRYELAAVLDDRYAVPAPGADGLLRGPVALAVRMLAEDEDLHVFVAIGSCAVRRRVAESLGAE